MPMSATIAADGCALVVRVNGYERPQLESGADANWLQAEVELTASTGGRFSARQRVSLRTDQLVRFRDQLASVVESLDGEAALDHMEEQVGCRVRLERGVGEFDACVRDHAGAELRVTSIRTDQSYLQRSLQELDALVATFPVKGQPLD
jgi:hypothetical protein